MATMTDNNDTHVGGWHWGFGAEKQAAYETIDWTQAACLGCGPEVFYPEGKITIEQASYARSVCRSCPIEAECGEYGRAHENYGMWGGVFVANPGIYDSFPWYIAFSALTCGDCGAKIKTGTRYRRNEKTGDLFCMRCVS